MKRPKVTTIIPAYNEAKFIVNALNFLASQLRPPDQVLVIDDCSTENTCDLVRNYDKIPCELIVNDLLSVPLQNGKKFKTPAHLKLAE